MRPDFALPVGPLLLSTVASAGFSFERNHPLRRRQLDLGSAISPILDGSAGGTTATPAVSPSTAPTVTAPFGNIWKELSFDEAEAVVNFLYEQPQDNVTANVNATAWDNVIQTIDLAVPNKTESLAYISGAGPAPPRMAYATIAFGATEEPYLEDFLIGPLPVDNTTTCTPYSFRTTKGTSRIRNYDQDQEAIYFFGVGIIEQIGDIIEDLLGLPANYYDWWGIDPLQHVDGRVLYWLGAWGIPINGFDSQTLLPQGLNIAIDQTGRDPSGWRFVGLLWDNVYYVSLDDFRSAWTNGTIGRPTLNVGYNSSWPGTDKAGPALPYDTLVAPMHIAPGGSRFAIDEENQYVSWGDFTFSWSFRRDTGIRLWNIAFNGTRIIYELGLTEALAHYAGNDAIQSGTAYLDSFYGFGPYALQLVPGYDCPAYAHFVNSSYHQNEVSTSNHNSLCFFEHDVGRPIQRHSSAGYVSVTKDIRFTMRGVYSIGNYDYTFSYTFALDGSIFVEVAASGYIQSAFWAHNDDYGYHIHDGLSGSMHEHILNFKADFDILGIANTVGVHSLEPFVTTPVWSNVSRSTMHLVRSELDTEVSMDWPADGKSMLLIYNKDEKNALGEDRAWRIAPATGNGMHATIQNSSILGPSSKFANNALHFTLQKDSEFSATSPNNDYDTFDPIIAFENYVNGESIAQEDLVLWFNLGMIHVPHSGDIPNTVMTQASSSLVFAPHNYLLSDPSRQTAQQLRIVYNLTAPQPDVVEVVDFGATAPSGEFAFSAAAWDPETYEGSAHFRKMPYIRQNQSGSTD